MAIGKAFPAFDTCKTWLKGKLASGYLKPPANVTSVCVSHNKKVRKKHGKERWKKMQRGYLKMPFFLVVPLFSMLLFYPILGLLSKKKKKMSQVYP